MTAEQNKKIGALSKGYRQRVGLAQALVHDPEVLILDEATTGLDPNQIIEIRKLITEAGKEKTIILSTHVMQEVEAICSRIIIIDKGVIVADEDKNRISGLSGGIQAITVEFGSAVYEDRLKQINNVSFVKRLNGNLWLIESQSSEDIRPLIFSFAVNNNITVLSLQKQGNKLEDVFRRLTND